MLLLLLHLRQLLLLRQQRQARDGLRGHRRDVAGPAAAGVLARRGEESVRRCLDVVDVAGVGAVRRHLLEGGELLGEAAATAAAAAAALLPRIRPLPAARRAPNALPVQALHAVFPHVVADGVGVAPALGRPGVLASIHPRDDLVIRPSANDLHPSRDDDALPAVGRLPQSLGVEKFNAVLRETCPDLVGVVEVLHQAVPITLRDVAYDLLATDPRSPHRLAGEGALSAEQRAPHIVLVVELHAEVSKLVADDVRTLPLLGSSGLLSLLDSSLDLRVGERALHGACCEEHAAPAVLAAPLTVLVVELHAHVTKLLSNGVRVGELLSLPVRFALRDQRQDVGLRGASAHLHLQARPFRRGVLHPRGSTHLYTGAWGGRRAAPVSERAVAA
mmetsp:Transcript_66145/g.167620  ORF Transcript_66145/g.167620 Transcript_66145/m.167620 type:complete len:389 (-) Transcript_66145:2-1168(-)